LKDKITKKRVELERVTRPRCTAKCSLVDSSAALPMLKVEVCDKTNQPFSELFHAAMGECGNELPLQRQGDKLVQKPLRRNGRERRRPIQRILTAYGEIYFSAANLKMRAMPANGRLSSPSRIRGRASDGQHSFLSTPPDTGK
jgi:hypothetical protein